MRDAESLWQEAGLGRISKSCASRICKELRDLLPVFCARDLSGIRLVCLFSGAIWLPVRPQGAKEGVLCAWGITEDGERVLLAVMLGMREAEEDWLALGRDLARRGLPCPMLVLSDGAPGLVKAIEELWPDAETASAARSTGYATCWRSSPDQVASASVRPTGRRSMRPSRCRTASGGCAR